MLIDLNITAKFKSTLRFFFSSYFHSFPAELHIIHYNQKYGDFETASEFADGLAVLAIMIEVYIPSFESYVIIFAYTPIIRIRAAIRFSTPSGVSSRQHCIASHSAF